MAQYNYFDTALGQWVATPIADHTHTFEPEVVVQTGQPSGSKTVLWIDTDEDYPPATGRNKIINGDCSVNQRAFPGSATSGVYGLDRWAHYFVGGSASYTGRTATIGELPESARYHLRHITSGQSAAGDYSMLSQAIEGVRTLSGKQVTVSFWARIGSGTWSLAVAFEQIFGGGGSPSANLTIPAGKVALTTSWTRYSVTATLPSISGKTLGTDGKDALWLYFFTSAGSSWNTIASNLGLQSGQIDIWGVQVEEGAYASAFEQKSYADELRACQRYFVRLGQIPGNSANARIGTGLTLSGTVSAVAVPLPVPMRAAVSTPYAWSTLSVYEGLVNVIVSSFSADQGSTTYPSFTVTTAAGLTVGRMCFFTANGSSGYCDFNAEF